MQTYMRLNALVTHLIATSTRMGMVLMDNWESLKHLNANIAESCCASHLQMDAGTETLLKVSPTKLKE